MGRNMLGSQRCRLFQQCVTCRRITSMLLLAPSGLAVPASSSSSSSVSAVCVLPASYTAVRPRASARCLFQLCLPGAYPRSPRLGEVAEF